MSNTFGGITTMFKKFFTTFLMTMMFAVTIPALAGSASAQRRDNDRHARYNNRNDDRYNENRNNNDRYNDDQNYEDDYYYDQYGNRQPKVYDRHRKAINLGIATGAGAVIGAIFGGKKGALIGAAAGAVTGAIITKKQRPRNTNNYPYQY